jgi:NADH-quinone oxidoreductase subunit C/D
LDNKIFIKRTARSLSRQQQRLIDWGYTGPLLRASGVNLDLRRADPYYGYDKLDFDIPVGTNGRHL